jgi:Protein tyrosine and serine/threonine kinase
VGARRPARPSPPRAASRTLEFRCSRPGLPSTRTPSRSRVSAQVRVAQDVAAALRALHASDRVHGALSTATVLVAASSGAVRLAPAAAAPAATARPEDAGDRVYYLAPEQVQDAPRPPRRSCDVWAFAATMLHAWTGERPYGSEALGGSAVAILRLWSGTPPDVQGAGLPEALERVLKRCLRAVPRERPAAAELLERLRRAAAEAPNAAPNAAAAAAAAARALGGGPGNGGDAAVAAARAAARAQAGASSAHGAADHARAAARSHVQRVVDGGPEVCGRESRVAARAAAAAGTEHAARKPSFWTRLTGGSAARRARV